MKYVLVFVVLALAFWMWRKNRSPGAAPHDERVSGGTQMPRSNAPPQLMVTCAHCGLHLPQAEAVTGQRAVYCSLAHRQKEEA